MQVYFDGFSDLNSVIQEFSVSEDIRDIEVIYASYSCENYEGWATVLFVRDGKLYEVTGSHCSCNGLEGLWVPEETSPLALLSRPNVDEQGKSNIKEYYKHLMCFL